MTDINVIEYGNHRHERAQRRKDAAKARQAVRAERSDREQLDVLYNRGINCGREYDRLIARIKDDEAGKNTRGKK